jgi:dTDP-4-amino-4,6-dideoxygalactose transaminase
VVPSLTFVATANAIRYTGATPVFADIASSQNLCISPATIKRSLTERTRAIIVMHYAGYACDMPGILELARQRGLRVIEDAAHAVGSELNGRKLGTWGDVGCYSFFSNKNLTIGEGGMLVTDDDAIAEQLRILRSHGMTAMTWDRHQGHAWTYDVVALGYNYRIDEIRAALGRVQLNKLERNNVRRKALTVLYQSLLQELAPSIEIPFQDHPGNSACHIMPVLLPAACNRIRFMEQMKAQGIQTSIHYPPIHTFKAYVEKGISSDNLPVTEDVASREVTLPLYPTMTENQAESVAQAVRVALEDNGNLGAN